MTEEREKRLQAFIASGKAFEPGFINTLDKGDKEDFFTLATINFLFSQSAKFRGKAIDIAIMLEAVLVEFLLLVFMYVEMNSKEALIAEQSASIRLEWMKEFSLKQN